MRHEKTGAGLGVPRPASGSVCCWADGSDINPRPDVAQGRLA